MKIKIIMLFLLLVVSGCSLNQSNDNDKWDLDAQYSSLQNDNSRTALLLNTEDTLLGYLMGSSQVYPISTGKQNFLFPTYLENDRLHTLIADDSSCSLHSPEECEHLIYGVDTLHYYKGKLYYFDVKGSTATQKGATVLYTSALDGSEKQELFTDVLHNDQNTITTYVPAYMQFHRNHIYVNLWNHFYIGDIINNELHETKIPGVDVVRNIFLFDETMMLTTDEYNDGNNVHKNAILECDLNGNVRSLLYEDMNAVFIDDKYVFYLTSDKNEISSLYMLSRNSKQVKRFSGFADGDILKYQDTYLLDSGDNAKNPAIMVLDKQGNPLCKKEYTKDEKHTPQLYIGNRYYVYLKESGCFAYYEITADGISDRKQIINDFT